MGLGFTLLATWLLGLSLAELLRSIYAAGFARWVLMAAVSGLPLGGLLSSFLARRRAELPAELGRLSFVNAILVLLVLWFVLTRSGAMSWAMLVAVAAAAATPFLFAGMVMASAYAEGIGRIERAHAAALAGTLAGAALLPLFLRNFRGPNTVIAAGVNFGIAAAFWFNRAGERQLRASSVLVALLLVLVMIMNGAGHYFELHAGGSPGRWSAAMPGAGRWVALVGLAAWGGWFGRAAALLAVLGAACGWLAFRGSPWGQALAAGLSFSLPALLRQVERARPELVQIAWSLFAAGCVWGLGAAT
jgi:hypothetical protein